MPLNATHKLQYWKPVCAQTVGVLQQYWAGPGPYEYVSVDQFSEAFHNSPTGQRNAAALARPYDKAQSKKEALVHSKRSLTGLPAVFLPLTLLLLFSFFLCFQLPS